MPGVLLIAMTPVWIILSVAAFIGTIISIKLKREAMRRKAMESVASTMGLPFADRDSGGIQQQLRDFNLFKKGNKVFFKRRNVKNLMRSTIGDVEVLLFDYSYMISNGNNSRQVSQTVFFANSKQWFLPNFHLRPERWWHKALKSMGMGNDINFEENQEFSEKFWLKSEFESVVRQQFTPELQQFMLERPPVHLEGNNYYLIAYKPGKLAPPDQVKHFFETCCDLVRQFQSGGQMELLKLADLQLEKQPAPPIEKSQ